LDLLVQPRKQDSSLGPVRKALASGVPVVAFENGATADVVRDGQTGLLVRSGTGPLVSAVGRLASDEVLRARLAANARESVSHRTWADAVAELVAMSAQRLSRSDAPMAG
ncbi:MAG: glycosyltransferase, partial [Marmoricola sp.]